MSRHVNNQLSRAPTSELGLICFLLELSSYLDRFNPYSIRLAAGFELRIDLIVDKSDHVTKSTETSYMVSSHLPFQRLADEEPDVCISGAAAAFGRFATWGLEQIPALLNT